MLARKRPDISWKDLAYGMTNSIVPGQTSNSGAEIPSPWFPTSESLVCLSVRSGFDLLLNALQLPHGSEVIVTSITIPDMLRIIEHHGLVPVPVSIDANRLEPMAKEIESAVTPRTRAILVAHLFGSHIEMQPIVDIAKRVGALVIEDCAQAFVGHEFSGHKETDAALFSFGPIKTATALGGAILRIRDDRLRNHMLQMQSEYPMQSQRSYALRLVKYALLKAASMPIVYGILVRFLSALGVDHDSLASQLARSFERQHFFSAIRQQPCETLKRMVFRRIDRFDSEDRLLLDRRVRIGRRLLRCLTNPLLSFPGSKNCTHTFWAVAVRVKQSACLVRSLRKAGFDATTRSSLCDAKTSRSEKKSRENSRRSWLIETIFLPVDPAMSARSLRRLCRVLKSVGMR